MTPQQAEQVAQLVNARNQLPIQYTAQKVLQHTDNYLFELSDETVIACVEVKKVQWYQWEICHLSVSENHERRGLGKRLIRRAEDKAKNGGTRIVQCTIRVGNESSEQTFRRCGYREACCFFNAGTGNHVAVWQKVLSTDQKPHPDHG
jgi:ribosomal protein S18 acetylase RimI-like enzyme